MYSIQCIHVFIQHTFDYKVNKRFQHGLRHQCCLDYRCNPKSGFDNEEHADIPAAIDLVRCLFFNSLRAQRANKSVRWPKYARTIWRRTYARVRLTCPVLLVFVLHIKKKTDESIKQVFCFCFLFIFELRVLNKINCLWCTSIWEYV